MLLGNGPDGRWTNPAGQFRMLKLAEPVYRLFGVEDALKPDTQPREPASLSFGRLGWYVRYQKGHFLTPDDWDSFLDYADRVLPAGDDGVASSTPRQY